MITATLYLTQYVRQSPEEVWNSLTTPHLAANWWSELDIKPIVGHRFPLDNTDTGPCTLEVIAVAAPHHLQLRMESPESLSTLTFTIRRYDTGSSFSLHHQRNDASVEAGKVWLNGMCHYWATAFRRASTAMGRPLPGNTATLQTTECYPSGLKITRDYDLDQNLSREIYTHTASHANLTLSRNYDQSGILEQEAYFAGVKAITKQKYETLRMHHPDMPAANALPDIEQQLSELKQEKLREWKAKSATHRPDPDYAHRNDTSMAALLMEPETLPLDGISDPSARVLFEHKSPTVKAIREQLARIGVHKAWLIDSHIEHLPNGKTEIEARGAILELPADPAIRKKAFLKIATSYVDLEFDAPQDNGQRYELVNLI